MIFNTKYNFITDYADYTDFRDCMQNSIITNCADYADIQYYMMTTLILETTVRKK